MLGFDNLKFRMGEFCFRGEMAILMYITFN
jgi:hypothetical protein